MCYNDVSELVDEPVVSVASSFPIVLVVPVFLAPWFQRNQFYTIGHRA